jgi:hypothetical protein
MHSHQSVRARVGTIAGVLLHIILLLGATASAGQQPPPIAGTTGTFAAEGTDGKVYEGINTTIVGAVDAIGHLFHSTDRPEEGSRVIVHETMNGGGLEETKGVITEVDRRGETVVIRLADGTRQTFRRAADGSASELATVVISFTDEAGRRVARYFTRVS